MIQVKFFASLKELYGEDIQIPYQEDMNVLGVWQLLTDKKEVDNNVLIAINQEYVNSSIQLMDGDELAFFPPVTGG